MMGEMHALSRLAQEKIFVENKFFDRDGPPNVVDNISDGDEGVGGISIIEFVIAEERNLRE